jgi:hypothetical protein
MSPDFEEFVADALKQANVLSQQQPSPENLPGSEPFKIRYVFSIATLEGNSRLVSVLVLPYAFPLTKEHEQQMIALRNAIVAKKGLMLVINENELVDKEWAWSIGKVGTFIARRLRLDSPDFIWLACLRNRGYLTTPDGVDFDALPSWIRLLCRGAFGFVGPGVGRQRVNIELMYDECPVCRAPMRTVTGVVFPDRQLAEWNTGNWFYYNGLIRLSALGRRNASILQREVDALRAQEGVITPVGYRPGQNVKAAVFAATCPHCHALRKEEESYRTRKQILGCFNPRFFGVLDYYSILLTVDARLLKKVRQTHEIFPQVCRMGWQKLPTPSFLESEQSN